MKCFIRSNNVQLSKTIRFNINQLVTKTFDRLQDKIHYVVISIRDVNGHKGGIDKQCSIQIVGDNPVDVQLTDTKETIQSALTSALKKAQKTYVTRLKKFTGKVKKRSSIKQYKEVQMLSEMTSA